MTDRQVLLLGNSHSQAVLQAGPLPENLDVYWLKIKDSARFGDLAWEEAQAKIAALRPEDLLVLMHLGALHNIFGLINHETPYYLSPSEGHSATAHFIPTGTMRAHLRNEIKREPVLATFSKIAQCPVYHCMTPPPKKAPPRPKSESRVYQGRSMIEAGYAPADLRQHMWQLEKNEITAYCTSLGVNVLLPPAETITEDGFLRPEYCASDATHANGAYGQKIIDQIAEALHA